RVEQQPSELSHMIRRVRTLQLVGIELRLMRGQRYRQGTALPIVACQVRLVQGFRVMNAANRFAHLVTLQIEHTIDAIRLIHGLDSTKLATILFDKLGTPAELRHRDCQVMTVRVDQIGDDTVLALCEEDEVWSERLPVT